MDLSSLSDDQLLQMRQKPPSADLSKISDADLLKMRKPASADSKTPDKRQENIASGLMNTPMDKLVQMKLNPQIPDNQNDNPVSKGLQATAAGANAVGEVAGKVGSAALASPASGFPAYLAATRPGAEKIAGGIQKAMASPMGKKLMDALNEGKSEYIELANKYPEAARDFQALVDIGKFVLGTKALKGGINGVKAAGGLVKDAGAAVVKGAEKGLSAASPSYAGKLSTAKATENMSPGEKLQAVRNRQYAIADNAGTKYTPELNDEFISKVESKIEQPRGENKPGLDEDELAEMKALQNSKKLSAKGKEALEDLETRNKETGLSSAQEKKNKIYNEYIKLYKENPITSFKGLRSLERELTDKIQAEINPATHKVNETGQALLDVRTHLHDMYLDPKGKFLTGSPKGIQAHLAANKAYSQEIKANQLEEAKLIGAGDATAERNAYRAMYKKALKQKQFWSEEELKELQALGKKPGALGKMVKGAVAHKTMGLSKLLPESAIDTSKLENLLLQGK